MVITFPTGYEVDLNHVPDDFEHQIVKCFQNFSDGTSDDFVCQDKLYFIDLMAEKINRLGNYDDIEYSSYDIVKKMILDSCDYELDSVGKLPDMEDFTSLDFIAKCYEQGTKDSGLYTHVTGDHHIYDKIMELECRAIKAIMNY